MVEFSLPGQGVWNIGSGDSGSGPRTFYLRENEAVDVGFLKLYLTTQCVNFSGLVQKSPFKPAERAEKASPERKERYVGCNRHSSHPEKRDFEWRTY